MTSQHLDPSTPGEWHVLAWAGMVLFLVLGSIGFYYAYHAPPEKAALAQKLQGYSCACYALAAGVYAINRGISWFVQPSAELDRCLSRLG
jgi:hypothetical protein